MSVTAVLTTESRNPACVIKSLSVDNESAEIKSTANGNTITTEVTSKSLRTLLSTLDDLIRCQIIAEKVIENG